MYMERQSVLRFSGVEKLGEILASLHEGLALVFGKLCFSESETFDVDGSVSMAVFSARMVILKRCSVTYMLYMQQPSKN